MAHPLALSRFVLRSLPACLLALAACVPEVELPDDAEACAGLRCNAGQCVSNAGQPMCRCGEWEANAGRECLLGGAEEQDDHGASPGDATELTLPMPKRQGLIGSLGKGGVRDRDLFAFTAEEQHVYSFSCGGGGSTLPVCQVRLLDDWGNPLVPLNQTLRDRERTVVAPLPAGRWYVEVTHDSQSGTYVYQLQDLGRDDHGDVPATATPMPAPGTAFPVVHTTQYDRDVFSFRALVGRLYTFRCNSETSAPGAQRRWELALTYESGGLLVSSPGFGDQASVSFTPMVTENLAAQVLVSEGVFPALSVCRLEEQ